MNTEHPHPGSPDQTEKKSIIEQFNAGLAKIQEQIKAGWPPEGYETQNHMDEDAEKAKGFQTHFKITDAYKFTDEQIADARSFHEEWQKRQILQANFDNPGFYYKCPGCNFACKEPREHDCQEFR